MFFGCEIDDYMYFFIVFPFFYQSKIRCQDKNVEDCKASEAELVSSISLINNMIRRSMMVVGVFPFFFFRDDSPLFQTDEDH